MKISPYVLLSKIEQLSKSLNLSIQLRVIGRQREVVGLNYLKKISPEDCNFSMIEFGELQLYQFLRSYKYVISGFQLHLMISWEKVVLLLPFLNTAYLLSYMTMRTHLMKNRLLIMSSQNKFFYSTMKN